MVGAPAITLPEEKPAQGQPPQGVVQAPGAPSGTTPPDALSSSLFLPSSAALNQAQDALQASQARQRILAERIQKAIDHQTKLAGDLAAPLPMDAPPPSALPPLPKKEPNNPASAFTTVLGAFAALAPLFTRRPLINTLTSFAGVVKGYHQGQQENRAYEMQRFNASYKEAMERHKEQMDQYNAVLNDRKLSVDEKIAQLSALGNATRDEVMLGQLDQGGVKAVASLLTERARLGEMVGLAKARMDAQREMVQGAITPEVVQGNAYQYISGVPLSQIRSGWGQLGSQIGLATQNAAYKILEDDGMSSAQAGEFLAAQQQRYRAGNHAALQIAKATATVAQGAAELSNLTPTVLSLIDQIGIRFPDANLGLQWLRNHTGDPVAAQLASLWPDVTTAWELVNARGSAGGVTDTVRRTIADALNRGMSPAQAKAVFGQLQDVIIPQVKKALVSSMNEAIGISADQVPGGSHPGEAASISAGTIEDGFKFKGGNPADPNAWEKVQ